MRLEEALRELSKLNEAPDNMGFETDDEIEAQERAEFEKRLAQRKADRDTAKKQELDRQEQERQKELARQEAEKKGKETLEKVKDLPFDDWFDYLVPSSGKADTVAGEIYRAIARIDYRFFNDGDVFYKGYGRDTCGSSVAYLIEKVNDSLINDFYDIAENKLDNGEYEDAIEKIKDNLKEYLLDNPELFGTLNEDDSRDSKKFDLDIEIPEPKDYEYTIYLGDYYTEDSYGDDVYLKDYIDNGIIDIWEVQSEVKDILRYENIDFTMERPWTHYDTEINLTDMTEEGYNRVKELVDDSHFLDDYISDLIEKHGLPNEQEVDESLKESKNNIPEKANLKKILDRYNSNGKFAKQGSWKIARGGYDLAFQLYYNDLALIDGINDGFSNNTTLELDQDTYGKNDEYDVKDLANYICQVYTDCKLDESIKEDFEDYYKDSVKYAVVYRNREDDSLIDAKVYDTREKAMAVLDSEYAKRNLSPKIEIDIEEVTPESSLWENLKEAKDKDTLYLVRTKNGVFEVRAKNDDQAVKQARIMQDEPVERVVNTTTNKVVFNLEENLQEARKTNSTPTEQILEIIKNKLNNSKYLVFEEDEVYSDGSARIRYHFNDELINQANNKMKDVLNRTLIEITVKDYSDDVFVTDDTKDIEINIYGIFDMFSDDWCESLSLDNVDSDEIVDYLEDNLGDDALLDNAQNNDTWEESLKENKNTNYKVGDEFDSQDDSFVVVSAIDGDNVTYKTIGDEEFTVTKDEFNDIIKTMRKSVNGENPYYEYSLDNPNYVFNEGKDKIVLILDNDLSTANATTPQGCAYRWNGKEPLDKFAKRCYEGKWKDGELIRDFENENHDEFKIDKKNNILQLIDYADDLDEDDKVSNFKFDYFISGQELNKSKPANIKTKGGDEIETKNLKESTTDTNDIHLDTELCDILDVNSYNTVIGELDIKDEELADEAKDTLAELISQVDGFSLVNVGKINHPKYYNYYGDTLEFTVKYNGELGDLIEKYSNDPKFIDFIKDRYKSYSGFVSFMADNRDDFIEQSPTKSVAQILRYEIGDPYDNGVQERFNDELWDNYPEYYDYEDEEIDESLDDDLDTDLKSQDKTTNNTKKKCVKATKLGCNK